MATAALTAGAGPVYHEHELRWIMTGSVDPSAGAGVAAPIATLYARDTGTAGTLWLKTGAADNAWTAVTLAA